MQIENHTIKNISFNSEADFLLIETYGMTRNKFRLDSWEKGLSLSREEDQANFSTHVNLSLFSSHQAFHRHKGAAYITRFTSKIPTEIKDLVTPISYAQLQTLQIVRQGGTVAIDLIMKAPALIWLVACEVLSNRISFNQAVNLVKGKHAEIIKAIRINSTKKHLKLMNKILPFQYCRKELRILNRILKDEQLQHNLRHLPQIVLPWVEIVCDSPEIQTIPCIQHEISNPNGSKHQLMLAKTMCESCLQIGQEVGLVNVKHSLRNCKTLSELTALETKWHSRFNKKLQKQLATFRREEEAVEVVKLRIKAEEERQRQERRERKRLENERLNEIRKKGFPKPPIPGNEYIVPITSSSELKHEGEIMNNCVATYEDKILFKNSYIYKVYFPERATLEVVGKKYCFIGELKAKNNTKPPSEVRQYIQEWIKKHCQ